MIFLSFLILCSLVFQLRGSRPQGQLVVTDGGWVMDGWVMGDGWVPKMFSDFAQILFRWSSVNINVRKFGKSAKNFFYRKKIQLQLSKSWGFLIKFRMGNRRFFWKFGVFWIIFPKGYWPFLSGVFWLNSAWVIGVFFESLVFLGSFSQWVIDPFCQKWKRYRHTNKKNDIKKKKKKKKKYIFCQS